MVFYRAICPNPHKRTIIKKIKGFSLRCPIFTFEFFILMALIPEGDSTLLNRLPLLLWINLFPIVYDEHGEESHKKQWERDTLLGFGSDISLANGKKLSLNSAVLRRILGICLQEKLMPNRDICTKIFYEELHPLCEWAAIPVKPAKACIDQLVSLHNKFLVMKKIPVKRQKSKQYHSNLREFQSNLYCLCDIAPSNVRSLIRYSRNANWQEDYNFIENQRQFPQLGFIGLDGVTRKREMKRIH
jgi:hypothetical protein